MDHLSTRMRRNGENLLVLAGEEPGRRWTEPVPLVDILRAASSEVEHYERIEISGIPETEIHGQVVNDLVHLLAELLENAASFSSPQSKVRVTATRLPDGRMMIEIHDKGIGLTAEDFADLNHKLANPPTVDAAVSQRMGLFVVGRLADRHGIRVQLRPSGEQAGTTSLVMLPDAITHGGGGEESPEEDFTVSRIVPEHPRGPNGVEGARARPPNSASTIRATAPGTRHGCRAPTTVPGSTSSTGRPSRRRSSPSSPSSPSRMSIRRGCPVARGSTTPISSRTAHRTGPGTSRPARSPPSSTPAAIRRRTARATRSPTRRLPPDVPTSRRRTAPEPMRIRSLRLNSQATTASTSPAGQKRNPHLAFPTGMLTV